MNISNLDNNLSAEYNVTRVINWYVGYFEIKLLFEPIASEKKYEYYKHNFEIQRDLKSKN